MASDQSALAAFFGQDLPKTPDRPRENNIRELRQLNFSHVNGHSGDDDHYNHVRADLTPSHITNKSTRISSSRALNIIAESFTDEEAEAEDGAGSLHRKRAALDKLEKQLAKKRKFGPEDFDYIGHHALEPRVPLVARLANFSDRTVANISAFKTDDMPEDIIQKWHNLISPNGLVSAHYVLLDPEIFTGCCDDVETPDLSSLSQDRKKELIKTYLHSLKKKPQEMNAEGETSDTIFTHLKIKNSPKLHVGVLKSDPNVRVNGYLSTSKSLLFFKDSSAAKRLNRYSVTPDEIAFKDDLDRGSWKLTKEVIKLRLIEMESNGITLGLPVTNSRLRKIIDAGNSDEIDGKSPPEAEIPAIAPGQEALDDNYIDSLELSDPEDEEEKGFQEAADADIKLSESMESWIKVHLALSQRPKAKLRTAKSKHNALVAVTKKLLSQNKTFREEIQGVKESKASISIKLESRDKENSRLLAQLERYQKSEKARQAPLEEQGETFTLTQFQQLQRINSTKQDMLTEREERIKNPELEESEQAGLIEALQARIKTLEHKAESLTGHETSSNTPTSTVPALAIPPPDLPYDGDIYRMIPPGRENAGLYRERSSRRIFDEGSGKLYEERKFMQELNFEVKGTSLESTVMGGHEYARSKENEKVNLVSKIAPDFLIKHNGKDYVKRILRREVEEDD